MPIASNSKVGEAPHRVAALDPVTKNRVFRAREVFQAFRKGLKAARMYPHGHRVRADLIQAFIRSAGALLDGEDGLHLRVTEAQLRLADEIVLEDEPGEELCGVMYSDGVRGLRFSPRTGTEELSQFFDLCATCQGLRTRQSETSDQDFVTSFWDADMVNVRVVLVDQLGFQLEPLEELTVSRLVERCEESPPQLPMAGDQDQAGLTEPLRQHLRRLLDGHTLTNELLRLGRILLHEAPRLDAQAPLRTTAPGIFGR
jgi:hypothetical protein